MIPTRPPARVERLLDDPAGEAKPERITPELKRRILRSILSMGLPSMASFLLLTVYDLIDVFWLSRLGEAPVAAVTVFMAYLWVLAFINQVVGLGSVAFISRRFGAGDAAGTELSIKNTFLAKLLGGVIFGWLGWMTTRPALALMGAEPDVIELGVAYGEIQWTALGLSFMSFSVYTALRGIGRPSLGMWVSVAGTIVNLALDLVLIFGLGPFPEMGVRGASLASALGFLTVTGWGLAALASPHSPVRVRWWRPPFADFGEMVQILRVGFPSGISGASFALSQSVIVKLVAVYGTSVVALFGMSNKVLKFGLMAVVGIGLGTSALVGQHIGARRLRRAWLTAVLTMQLAGAVMLVFATIVVVFAPAIVGLFFTDPALVEPGTTYLRLLALGLPFFGVYIGGEQAYAGAGKNTPTMIMDMVTSWALTIPLMFVLGRVLDFGPNGMMLGSSLGQVFGAAIAVWLVRRGSWLVHRV